MVILTINTGSASVRLAVFARDARGGLSRRASAQLHPQAGTPAALLKGFLETYAGPEIGAVAHRVVHGGARLTRPCRVDEEVHAEIRRLAAIAPLHNPQALAWMHGCKEVFGAELPQIAVFDTAFFEALPAKARRYALPREFARQHELRRYGFHGVAHAAMLRRLDALTTARRVISLQLGGGCSVTASRDGKPLDTSMGFSPLEGLVMATRCGDLDPGAVTYLIREAGVAPEDLEEMLNSRSGLLGVSEESGDMRVLLSSERAQAEDAIELYCYRARKYIGAYLAVLGGADALLFGGGVGEHAPAIRARILAGMEWAGVRLDVERNRAAMGNEGRISSDESAVAVWVIPVDEESALAAEAAALLEQGEQR